MGLQEIQDELENTRDEKLDEVIDYFVKNPIAINVSDIQRYFKVGWYRANRIIRQIDRGM